MGRSLLSGVLTTVMAMLLAGCGTITNLNGDPIMPVPTAKPIVQRPTVFGGVDRDLGNLQLACFAVPQYPSAALYALGYLADVPLSFVGDVVTIPIVLSGKNEENTATPEAARP